MDSQGKFPFSFKPSGGVQTLLGTLTIAALIWLAGLAGKSDGWIGDPAGDAEAAYSLILEQMGSDGPARTQTPGSEMVFAAAGPMEKPSLNRDLFTADKKVQKRIEIAATGTATRKKWAPPLPALSAILIDGSARQAVLSGEIAGVGDVVTSFNVLEIGESWVKVGRYGAEYILTMEKD